MIGRRVAREEVVAEIASKRKGIVVKKEEEITEIVEIAGTTEKAEKAETKERGESIEKVRI